MPIAGLAMYNLQKREYWVDALLFWFGVQAHHKTIDLDGIDEG